MRMRSRVDANQAEIVAGLLYLGATVQHLHAVGHGCPDILVGFKGVNYLIEIKDGNKPPSARKLTPDQERWHILWSGQKAIATSAEEAVKIINGVQGHDQ
jgi:hypothetical protein